MRATSESAPHTVIAHHKNGDIFTKDTFCSRLPNVLDPAMVPFVRMPATRSPAWEGLAEFSADLSCSCHSGHFCYSEGVSFLSARSCGAYLHEFEQFLLCFAWILHHLRMTLKLIVFFLCIFLCSFCLVIALFDLVAAGEYHRLARNF